MIAPLLVLFGVSLFTPGQVVIAKEIELAAHEAGVPASYMLQIAQCESHLNPAAYNPKDGGSPSYGIYQFKKATFYGNGGEHIWVAKEQIKIAAKMMAEGKWNAWRNCYHVAIKKVQNLSLAEDVK
jgi:hypothetical protein